MRLTGPTAKECDEVNSVIGDSRVSRMYRVIDTIVFRREWLAKHPELPQSEGLLIVLDSEQLRAPSRPIASVKVVRPDGSSEILRVDETRTNAHDIVGLFFAGIQVDSIPQGSLIQPLE